MSKSERRGSPFDVAAPRVFSIDAGRPFLDDLAEGLIDALGEDLAQAEIFLPTRRAVRAAADAILNACESRGARAALLPRFRAIGDIDADEIIAFAGEARDEIDLAPALSPTERLVTLAQFVAARDRAFAGQENWNAAIGAARELGKLLDTFYTEEKDPAVLKALDVADAAGHWANALKFLTVVTEEWPAYLEKIGRTDPAVRRARLIGATANRLSANPPAHPLVIAGTTGSAPAVTRLVDAVARAPRGVVVLPGLDRTMDARAWALIEDAHPQSGLKALLGELKLEPGDVAAWRNSGTENPRTELLTLALRPAEATDDWLSLIDEMTTRDDTLSAATNGLALIEADNEESEASVVAALFREALETPGKTAVLVTPDRNLSRRVALKMRRWNVNIDDSAGVPFANTPCGLFLRLVALYLEDPADPVSLLALVRHPHARLGLDRDERAGAVDSLDRALRGTRPANGLRSVEEKLRANEKLFPAVQTSIETICEAAEGFSRDEGASFGSLIAAHIAAAEQLSSVATLWSGDDGEKGAELLAELRMSADAITAIGGRRYAEVFSALIAGAAVRKRSDAHPRLSILGPLEARLQSADHIILGGLNEGGWPSDAASDPFLSRKMRGDLGLPSPERKIGLSAHDFACLAAHARVTLTRSKRAGGKPANPSRWIVRLKNILTGASAVDVDRSDQWKEIVARVDMPERVHAVERPRPLAGLGRRPAKVSVTRVEKWLRDPYSVYARYLLNLRKIEEPGIAFGAREMGNLLHKVFEKAALNEQAPTAETLQRLYDREKAEFGLSAADARFWSSSVAGAFSWFAEFDAARRAEGRVGAAEGSGEWTIEGIDPPFTLTAKADRIDILNDGCVAIVDYKLSRIPSENQIKHFSPQLPLTGALVDHGAFTAIGAASVASYAYQRLVGRKEKESNNSLIKEGDEAKAAIDDAVAGLKAWIRRFDDPKMVYHSQPRPEFGDDYGDFDQLARRKEWGAAEDADSGGGE